MICYKDKTFCSSDCTNSSCFRFFSEEERQGAIKWSEGLVPEGEHLVAFSDFSDVCPWYTK